MCVAHWNAAIKTLCSRILDAPVAMCIFEMRNFDDSALKRHCLGTLFLLVANGRRKACTIAWIINSVVSFFVMAFLVSFLAILAVASIAASLDILFRGELYRSLKPNSRPRRWVMVVLLLSLATTFVWLPVFLMWPHAVITRVLTVFWGTIFFSVTLTLRFEWLSGAVDQWITRRGWQLR